MRTTLIGISGKRRKRQRILRALLEKGECKQCKQIREGGGFGPHHFASSNCESGKRNHCTCDVCF